MNAREWDPRLIWTFQPTVGEPANNRTPLIGLNPYQLNSYYTGALFQLRCIAQSGTIAVNRVLIYGSMSSNGFGAPGQGIADQHVIARWGGGVQPGFGQLRQPKGADTNVVPITRKRMPVPCVLPAFILLEWNTNPAGDPGATKLLELWGFFSGPEVRGVA